MLRTVDTYCHSCKQKTHHKVLFTKEVTNGYDDEVYGSSEYCVVQCCGCDSISFLRVDFDESWEDKDGNLIPVYTSYPFREGHVEPISSWIMPRRPLLLEELMLGPKCKEKETNNPQLKYYIESQGLKVSSTFKVTISSIDNYR